MKSLAILILNYNGKHYLKKCIESLNKQTSKDFDVWLVDNNSSDGSRAYVEKNYPKVHVLNTNGNLGFAGAYNVACKYFDKKNITYMYYQLLNNDTECDSLMVEKVIDTFELNKKIGIVVPAVVNEKMIVDALGGTMIPITGTTIGYKGKSKYKRGSAVYRCFWASGCALCVRSKLFKKLGYFNDYFIYYEDVDISWRVNNAGMIVAAIDSTYVKHLQGGAKTPSDFVLYLNERNRILCYWQNLPRMMCITLLPLLLVLRLLLLFYLSSNSKNVFGKMRGIVDGLIFIPRYKRRIYSLNQHLSTILQMSKVTKL